LIFSLKLADGITVISGPFAFTPASFLLTNTNNEVLGNVAAGSNGTGFWIKPEATSGTLLLSLFPFLLSPYPSFW